jgi:hypothetical protein
MTRAYDKIAAGLNEALAVAQGKTTLEKRDVFGFTTRRASPIPPARRSRRG